MFKADFRKAFIFGDILASGLAWSLFFVYRKVCIETVKFGVAVPFSPNGSFFAGLALVPALWFLIYYSSGAYTDIRRQQPGKTLLNLLFPSFFGVLLIFFVLILDDTVISYRTYYFSFLVLMSLQMVLVFLVRWGILLIKNRRFNNGTDSFKVVLLGNDFATKKFCSENATWLKKNYIEIVTSTACPRRGVNFKIFPDSLEAEEIFIVDNTLKNEELEEVLFCIYRKDLRIRVMPEIYANIKIPLKLDQMFNAPIMLLSRNVLPTWQLSVKTFFDVVISGMAAILLLPLILALAAAIKFTSPGPVIYSHVRVGKNGRPFRIFKFRSMREDSEPQGPQLASIDDGRITAVGRFMRKRRLDEIPNFINVFRGEMSLVGPRPERPFYIEQILEKAPQYSKLHLVKPGITSWGQVKFGYAGSVDEMVRRMKYDLVYIENMSLLADMQILAKTIGIIVKGQGV